MALLPHATTKQGVPFGGDFSELLSVPMLAKSFQSQFIERLQLLRRDALYLGLGRCAWAGLRYAVERGLLRQDQLVGVFPSPARSGKMLDYFVREVSLEQLAATRLRHHQVEWLDAAYEEMTAAIERLGHRGILSAPPTTSALTMVA
ncbi:hypothetical protein PO002_27640 [Cupriavidus necator]|uniref:hypothetical protein n=1 Tax=Cupriavidus necator TaxID=106590 RepID=UPI0039C2795B